MNLVLLKEHGLLLAVAAMTLIALLFLVCWLRARHILKLTQVHHDHEISTLTTELSRNQERFQAVQQQMHDTTMQLDAQRDAAAKQAVDLSIAKTQLNEQEKHYASQIELLKEAKQTLSTEFELLANKLFTIKQEQFKQSATENLTAVISPFKSQLSDFYKRVEEAQKMDSAQRHQLMGQITELQKQSQSISVDAVNLTNALKGNNKVQGNWGEYILEKLLEQVGFVAGREYDLQVSGRDEHGRLFKPDAVIHLPGGRDLIVDSKVSLIAYEKYMNEGQDGEHLKAHYDSVVTHIKGLSGKKYDALENIQSLEFVFLFIPIEHAYTLLVHHYPDILQVSYDRQVIIVSPASIMVALRTVESLWQRDLQDKNIEKLVISAGRLYDQFVLFAESLSAVGVQLNKATEYYDLSLKRLTEGRGNLLKRVESLRELGAKTSKKLPEALLSQLRSDDDASPEDQAPEQAAEKGLDEAFNQKQDTPDTEEIS